MGKILKYLTTKNQSRLVGEDFGKKQTPAQFILIQYQFKNFWKTINRQENLWYLNELVYE